MSFHGLSGALVSSQDSHGLSSALGGSRELPGALRSSRELSGARRNSRKLSGSPKSLRASKPARVQLAMGPRRKARSVYNFVFAADTKALRSPLAGLQGRKGTSARHAQSPSSHDAPSNCQRMLTMLLPWQLAAGEIEPTLSRPRPCAPATVAMWVRRSCPSR